MGVERVIHVHLVTLTPSFSRALGDAYRRALGDANL